jgi:hypothetical protein
MREAKSFVRDSLAGVRRNDSAPDASKNSKCRFLIRTLKARVEEQKESRII